MNAASEGLVSALDLLVLGVPTEHGWDVESPRTEPSGQFMGIALARCGRVK